MFLTQDFVFDMRFSDLSRFCPLAGLMELFQSPERESEVVMYLAASAFLLARCSICSPKAF